MFSIRVSTIIYPVIYLLLVNGFIFYEQPHNKNCQKQLKKKNNGKFYQNMDQESGAIGLRPTQPIQPQRNVAYINNPHE